MKRLTQLTCAAILGLFSLLPIQAIAADTTENEAPKLIASGEFVGMGGHEASGGFELLRDDAGYIVRFGEDFLFDGAPDPRLGFGYDKYWPKTEFAKLQNLKGQRDYRLPHSAQLDSYDSFWIWCEAFSLAIGRVDLLKH